METLAELKEKYPVLLSEYKAELEAEFEKQKKALQEKLDKEKTDLEAKFAQEKADLEKDFTTKLADRDDRIMNLEKKDIVRTENERQVEADRIWSEKLANSGIDPKLHEKVKRYISHSKFVKDDVFDKEAFTDAVEAEIKDWMTRLPVTSVLGGGVPGKEVVDDNTATQDAEDEKLADDIFKSSGGKMEEVK